MSEQPDSGTPAPDQGPAPTYPPSRRVSDVEVTAKVADEIRRRRAAGERVADIGRDHDMTSTDVRDVLRGRARVLP
jgi:hypothetical protein